MNLLQTFSIGFKNFPSVRRRRKKNSSSVLAYQRKSSNLPPLKLNVLKLGLANVFEQETNSALGLISFIRCCKTSIIVSLLSTVHNVESPLWLADAGHFMGVQNIRSDPSPRWGESHRRWYKHIHFHDLTYTATFNLSMLNIKVN
ncbi:hypothetical protein TNCV_984171 [Trichonephila clavipes]|nr:hypothetical protein TNCV_984171 [Trichonephila clavipes]